MKRLLLTAGLLLAVVSGFSQARKVDRGDQLSSDSKKMARPAQSADFTPVMMACVNQPGMEKYYATTGRNAINVVGLPAGTTLPANAKALGRALKLDGVDKVRSSQLTNYFYFGNVKNENGHTTVSLTYFYDHSKAGYKVVMVDMELVKNGNQYQIVHSKFKGDLL